MSPMSLNQPFVTVNGKIGQSKKEENAKLFLKPSVGAFICCHPEHRASTSFLDVVPSPETAPERKKKKTERAALHGNQNESEQRLT